MLGERASSPSYLDAFFLRKTGVAPWSSCMVCHAWEREVLEIRYCRYVSDAKESLVVKGTNYTMFVPDLNAEVNLAVSAGRVGWYKKIKGDQLYWGGSMC